MWSGLDCPYALLGHESVPTVCTGNGQAHTTLWFPAPLARLPQSSLMLKLNSCPCIAVPNPNFLAAKVREMLPEKGWWAALFYSRTLQILTPWDDLPPAEAPWPSTEEQPCGCAWHRGSALGKSPLHRQAIWVIYILPGQMYFN